MVGKFVPVEHDWSKGYPREDVLFFECLECGTVLSSMPLDSVMCECQNIAIDVDAGRVSVRDHGKLRLVRKVEELRGNGPFYSSGNTGGSKALGFGTES